MTMKKLSHYDKDGRASMVDVSAKAETRRTATAQAFVKIRPAVLKKLPKNPKGDPLEVARIRRDRRGQADLRTDPHVPSADAFPCGRDGGGRSAAASASRRR